MAHPVSPQATLIHPLLLDLSEVESNNKLWPQYYFTKERPIQMWLRFTKCAECLQTIWADNTLTDCRYLISPPVLVLLLYCKWQRIKLL